MSNVVKILYDGKDAFYPLPTPFVGVGYDSIYYGEKWVQQENITLNGQITGCSFEKIVSGYNQIVQNFKKNYQDLEIWQIEGATSGRVFLKQFVEVNSISIPDSRWLDVMPYTIELSCYPSGYFSGVFGVLDPSDSWSYSEQQNATMQVTHNIGCRPINTSKNANNALDNARTWAFSRSGTASSVAPIFISGISVNNFFLISQEENIDRFNGNYSLVENYSNDLARSGYGTIRYATTIESGNNLITISLDGVAEGGDKNISGLRTAFSRINKTAIAAKQYKDIFNMSDLNPIPLTQSFSEDPFETRINFNYSYNNDNTPPLSFDYTVGLETALNGNITANIDGTIRARGGVLSDKLSRSLVYADTINLYNLILPFYNNFDISASLAPLNPVPLTSGKSINQSNGTVALNATFNNKQKVSTILDEFNFVMNFQPSVVKVDSQPVLDGQFIYSAVDLGYANRASLTINGNARVGAEYSSAAGENAIKQACYLLFAQYGRGAAATLDQNNVSFNRVDNKLASFSFSWSFDSPYRIGAQSLGYLSV